MTRTLSAFVSGALFGGGLLVSGMVDPAKVLAFFDIAGAWDPSLGLTMVIALAVAWTGYRYCPRRGRPVFEATFDLPSRDDIDGRLVIGSVLFGLGWGLVGYCPGPALVGVGGGITGALWFSIAMVGGMALWRMAEGILDSRAAGQGA